MNYDKDFRTAIDSWKVGRILGKGASGVVRIATARDDENHQVAMKIVDRDSIGRLYTSAGHKDEDIEQLILSESQLLRMLNHPNIVQLECTFFEDHHFISCIEYVDGDDLSSYVAKYTPNTKQIQQLFYQLCSAISYCHSQMVVHGDLKCENVLIRKHDQSVKVIDFGFSRQLKLLKEELPVLGQTTEYSPPLDRNLSLVWDSWSVGVILYVMIKQCLPFTLNQLSTGEMSSIVETSKKVENGQIFNILMALWELNPRQRALIGDLMNESPWLKEMAPQTKKKEPVSFSPKSSSVRPFSSCSSISFRCSLELPRSPFGSKTPPNSFLSKGESSLSFPETSSSPGSFILFESSTSGSSVSDIDRTLKIQKKSTNAQQDIERKEEKRETKREKGTNLPSTKFF